MQPVLQHCCKTSWLAMLRALPPTFKFDWQQIRLRGFFTWVAKRAPSLFNSICGKIAGQVARFCVGHFTVPWETTWLSMYYDTDKGMYTKNNCSVSSSGQVINRLIYYLLPCEHRFLSGLAVSINKVVRTRDWQATRTTSLKLKTVQDKPLLEKSDGQISRKIRLSFDCFWLLISCAKNVNIRWAFCETFSNWNHVLLTEMTNKNQGRTRWKPSVKYGSLNYQVIQYLLWRA